MPISDKLIDQLLDGCDSPDDILGEAGLLDAAGNNSGNSRNGKTKKAVRSTNGCYRQCKNDPLTAIEN